MSMAVLCREMGWTFQEYMSQPTWFIHMLVAYMQAESNYREKQSKK
jgi:hypothetical protein